MVDPRYQILARQLIEARTEAERTAAREALRQYCARSHVDSRSGPRPG